MIKPEGTHPAAACCCTVCASESVETKQWWKKQAELWVDVHTEEQFYHEINTGSKLVFVGGQAGPGSAIRRSSCVSSPSWKVDMKCGTGCLACKLLPEADNLDKVYKASFHVRMSGNPASRAAC